MNDRELLRLAAKAAGVPARVAGAAPGHYALHPDTDGVAEFCCMPQWNSLTDDGDNARMEAKLNITNEWYQTGVASGLLGGARFMEAFANHGSDKQAARRRASTRAAAEIGKSMTQKTGE